MRILRGLHAIAIVTTLLQPGAGLGQEALFLKDINTGPTRSVTQLVDVAGTLFFVSNDATSGTELWKSDGTPAGTALVKDIRPGTGSSTPRSLVDVNGTLYFVANDGVSGNELWKSDGTAAGTVRVKDIVVGPLETTFDTLVNVNGTLFFLADDGVLGLELWKSDGTAAGTVVVKDIWPGPASSSATSLPGPASSSATSLTVVGGTLFFAASNGLNGMELWKSDGTTAGTAMVADLYPGPGGSYPRNLRNVNGTLYFTAISATGSAQLWRSDGSAAGTVLVKTFSGFSDALCSVGSTIYLTLNGDELWKSDGTAAGTVLVKDITPLPGPNLTQLTAFEGSLYFVAVTTGWGLWKSDGTAAGTGRVTDIYSGAISGTRIFSASVARAGANLYFTAEKPGLGSELWKTDGTEVGSTIVKDIAPGAGGSFPLALKAVGATLYFAADDGVNGVQLWKTDGTEAGTVALTPAASTNRASQPRALTHVNGQVYFVADDGVHGAELWRSDGTATGTTLVKDIAAGSLDSIDVTVNALSYANVNGTLFFLADDRVEGNSLWKTDGTAAGTTRVKNLAFGFTTNLTAVGNTLFFTSGELWKSDGTEAGTVVVKEIHPGTSNSYPRSLTNVNGTLFFTAYDGVHGEELWKSDGTGAGTVLVRDIAPGPVSSSPLSLLAAGGRLFFVVSDGVYGYELWSSDGTAAGTAMVRDLNPGGTGSFPGNLTDVNGTVFFTADDGTGTLGLYRSNGTAAGTLLVTNAFRANIVQDLTAVNGTLFFVAEHEAHGRELWKSDGTPGGTLMVKDIAPGTRDAFPFVITHGARRLVNVADRLYFTANDGVSGTEFWTSDGTAAGTVMLQDIVAGDFGGPINLTAAQGRLFFTLDDGVRGEELWVLAPGGVLSRSALAADFGAQSMRTSSGTRRVSLTNAGTSPISVASVQADGPFSATHDCGSVAPGASCTITVILTPLSQGAASGTLTIVSSVGTQSMPLQGSGERSLVAHYYNSILRRDPDVDGKAYWESESRRVAQLGANLNEAWFAMAMSFYNSTEYLAHGRNPTEYVRDLYGTFFNRVADNEGLSYWTGQMAGGMPREVVLTWFMFSAEFGDFASGIFGNTRVRAEIDTVVDFYRGLLSRLPDSAGLTHWIQQFRSAQCQGAAAVYAQVEAISGAFATSAEYEGRGRTNAQYVGDVYNAFMRRGGDLAGVRYWIDELDSGRRSRASVRQAFMASPEFSARVQAILSEGCAL